LIHEIIRNGELKQFKKEYTHGLEAAQIPSYV